MPPKGGATLKHTPSLRKLNGVGVGGWGKRVAPYVLIMRAVTREMAFEQRQAIDHDDFAGQRGFAFEPGGGVGGAGAAAGEGDVGQIGAAIERDAGADQRLVDPGMGRGVRGVDVLGPVKGDFAGEALA